jgi:hypothetical protein
VDCTPASTRSSQSRASALSAHSYVEHQRDIGLLAGWAPCRSRERRPAVDLQTAHVLRTPAGQAGLHRDELPHDERLAARLGQLVIEAEPRSQLLRALGGRVVGSVHRRPFR